MVAQHPWPFAVVGGAILVSLAAPFLSIRYGQSDDGNPPTTEHPARRAYDLIAEGFGPGANGPLAVVVTYPKGETVAVVRSSTRVEGDTGRRLRRARADEPGGRHRGDPSRPPRRRRTRRRPPTSSRRSATTWSRRRRRDRAT